ncbi:hypothetical protein GCM10010182_80460 [Actinomadura cremea]|nr:hypothetical protein GCM10010182_80460 [Actinomadura cremea]
MSSRPDDSADGSLPPVVHAGRWHLPGARWAAARARRVICTALRQWELGAAADTLAWQAASLIRKLAPRLVGHAPGQIELRLELRPADRLLLIQLQRTTPERPEADNGTLAEEDGRHIIAIVYGHRRAHNGPGIWYTRTFVWHRPDSPATDH